MRKQVWIPIVCVLPIIAVLVLALSWVNNANNFPSNLESLAKEIATNVLSEEQLSVEDTTYHPGFEIRRQLTISRDIAGTRNVEDSYLKILKNILDNPSPVEGVEIVKFEEDEEFNNFISDLSDETKTSSIAGCEETTSGSVKGFPYLYCSESYIVKRGETKVMYLDVVVDNNTSDGNVKESLVFIP